MIGRWNSSVCQAAGRTERETRYYITSLRPDAARLNRVIRQRWGIEKQASLGARRLFWRRPGPKTSLSRGAKLLRTQPHRARSAQTGDHFQTRNQGKETQSRLEPPLAAQINWELDMRRPWNFQVVEEAGAFRSGA